MIFGVDALVGHQFGSLLEEKSSGQFQFDHLCLLRCHDHPETQQRVVPGPVGNKV